MSKPKYMKREKTVEQYDQEYDELVANAVNQYSNAKDAAKRIKEFLSRRSKRNFGYANVHSRKVFRTQLKSSVAGHWPDLSARFVAYGLFTFVHKDWVCNEHGYVDLAKIKEKGRNAMGGVNFIAVIEHAFYVNEHVEKDGQVGKMICVHVHAIAWDTTYRRLEKKRAAARKRFVAPFPGFKKTVHLAKRVGLDDLMETVDYVTKMNLSGYRTTKDGKGQRAGKMSNRDHHSLFQLTHDRSLFEYWFAGGEGSAILKQARAACEGKRPQITEEDLADQIDELREREEDRKAENKRNRRQAGKWRTVRVTRADARWEKYKALLADKTYDL